MAHTYISTPQTSGSFGRAVVNVTSQIRSWNDARKTRATLSKLSAHELEDIGLVPGDLDHIQ